MGADGGSIPDRNDLVKTKAKAAVADKAALRALWFFCCLSKVPLKEPVVTDQLGKLYNKEAVIEYLLDRSSYGDGDQICGHLKGVKDLLTLRLTPNPSRDKAAAKSVTSHSHEFATASRAPFVCPLSQKEMAGQQPFIALRTCGCVFSEQGLRAVVDGLSRGPVEELRAQGEEKRPTPSPGKEVACPNCGKQFDPTSPASIQPLNPPSADQELLLENLLATRAATKSKSKKRKNGVEEVVGPAKVAKPRIEQSSAMAASIRAQLKEQEELRLKAMEGMSDAVKAMFKPKEKGKDHHSGNEDFFGRTFTRYA